MSKCCSVLTPELTRCPKPSLLHLLTESNPTLQLYFIMKHYKRLLAEHLPHFQVRKGFLWRGKGAALQQTSLFSPSCTPVQLPVTLGEEQPSDLRSLNGCKNLWGETKYLGNSCCWPLAGLKCWEASERGVSAKIKRKFPQAKYLCILKCFLLLSERTLGQMLPSWAEILISLQTEGEFHPWHQRVKHILEMGRRRAVSL